MPTGGTAGAGEPDEPVGVEMALRVCGEVVDGERGGPIARASLSLATRDEEISDCESNDKGRFCCEGPKQDGVWLVATAEGYSREARSLRLSRSEPLRIGLTRSACISGRVEDEAGQPVSGSTVWDQSGFAGLPLRPGPGDETAVTDKNGAFVLEHVRAGRRRTEATAFLRVAHPDFVDAVQSIPAPKAGESRDGVVMTVGHGCALAGRVVDRAGGRVSGAVVLFQELPEQVAMTWQTHELTKSAPRTAADGFGRFRFDGLPCRKGVLVGSSEGIAGEAEGLPTRWVEADIEVVLARVPFITGRVQWEGGKPAESVRVSASPAMKTKPESGVAALFALNVAEPTCLSVATTGADGRFKVCGAMGGRVDLEAEAGGGTAIVTVDCDATDVVVLLKPAGVLEVELQPHGAGAFWNTVALKRESTGHERTCWENPCRIESLEPGLWRVSGQNPQYGVTSEVEATVRQGEVVRVRLEFRVRAVARGVVRSESGQALFDARVEAFDFGEGAATLHDGIGQILEGIRTDEEGRFEIPVGPAVAILQVRRAGYRTSFRRLVVEGREVDVGEIRLAPGEEEQGTSLVAGVGMTPQPGTSPPVIASVVPGSPAARAGISAGDVVLAVDGVDVVALGEWWMRVRGEPGTSVELRLRRSEAVFTVRMVREIVVFR